MRYAIMPPMLTGRVRIFLSVMALAVVAAVGAWLLLPRVTAALPGRVRQYLPNSLAIQTAPPLPTPLPVSAIDSAALADVLGADAALSADTASTTPTTPPTMAPSLPAAEPIAPLIPAPEPSATPTVIAAPDYSQSVYLDGVEIIPQKFNNCGPTNLTMVLNYHGVPADQLVIAGVIRPNYEDRNVSPEELAAYVTTQSDLKTAVMRGGDLDQLKRLLAAGLPVIVEQGLLPDEATGWMGHYLTLYGYDEVGELFYTRDSFLGPWDEDGTERYADVVSNWRPFNNVLIVVFPPEQEGLVATILGERHDDPAAMWRWTAEQARAAIRANGDAPFEWFNLGSSLTRLYDLTGDPKILQQAVASFDQARLIGLPARMLWYQFDPYEAYLAAGRTADAMALADATLGSQGGRSVEETYVYRALAHRALGNEQEAIRDLSVAEAFNPANPVLQRALTSQP